MLPRATMIDYAKVDVAGLTLSEAQWRRWSESPPALVVVLIDYRHAGALVHTCVGLVTDGPGPDAPALHRINSMPQFEMISAFGHHGRKKWDTRTDRLVHDDYGRTDFEQFPDLPDGYGMTDPGADQTGVVDVYGRARVVRLDRAASRDFLRRVAEGIKTRAESRGEKQTDGYRWVCEAIAKLSA